jgi:CDP-6-deoxy-D-xylo-4-hexulose-3-dehydrase
LSYELAKHSWGEEESNTIQQVINSGHFTIGSEIGDFERAFEAWHSLKYGVMINFRSSANLISVASFSLRMKTL